MEFIQNTKLRIFANRREHDDIIKFNFIINSEYFDIDYINDPDKHLVALVQGNKYYYIEIIFEKFLIDINHQGSSGATALMFAVKDNNFKIVKLLLTIKNKPQFLKNIENPNKYILDIDIVNDHNETAVDIAYRLDHIEIFQLLFEYESTISKYYKYLFDSIKNNRIEIFKLLIQDNRININIQNDNYLSLLTFALKINNDRIISLLLDRDDLNINLVDDNKNTAIFYDAECCDYKYFKKIINYKHFNVNVRNNNDTPLIVYLIYNNKIDLLKLILEFPNLDIDSEIQEDYSIMSCIIEFCDASIIEKCLKISKNDIYSNPLILKGLINFKHFNIAKTIINNEKFNHEIYNYDASIYYFSDFESFKFVIDNLKINTGTVLSIGDIPEDYILYMMTKRDINNIWGLEDIYTLMDFAILYDRINIIKAILASDKFKYTNIPLIVAAILDKQDLVKLFTKHEKAKSKYDKINNIIQLQPGDEPLRIN